MVSNVQTKLLINRLTFLSETNVAFVVLNGHNKTYRQNSILVHVTHVRRNFNTDEQRIRKTNIRSHPPYEDEC